MPDAAAGMLGVEQAIPRRGALHGGLEIDGLTKPRTNKGGRPSIKSKVLIDRLCAMLEDGVPIRRAAKWMGISESVIRHWLSAADADAARLRDAASSLLRCSLGLIARKIREEDREDLAQWIVERRIVEYRRPSADPVLDLLDELDEESREKVRTIIVEGLATKRRGKA